MKIDEMRKAILEKERLKDARDTALGLPGSHPPVAPTPAQAASMLSSAIGASNAKAVLQRIRQWRQPPPRPDLRIVERGAGGVGIGRFKIGASWWVRFDREIDDDEHNRLDTWCKQNCAKGYRQTHTDRYTFHDEDDCMLFQITFA